MGPQSLDCGRYAVPTSSHSISRLQWGRSHSTAEGRRGHFSSRNYFLLQWGRSHSTAEGGLNQYVSLNAVLTASMGPQSLDCGRIGVLYMPDTWTQVLQWGRSHSTAEGVFLFELTH